MVDFRIFQIRFKFKKNYLLSNTIIWYFFETKDKKKTAGAF
jgi:hypothetical protein